MKPNSFLTHAAIFGFGSMLIPISGVLLLPLYVNYLSPDEFGTLEIVNRLANVLCICCLSVGVTNATNAFYMQAEDESRRKTVAATLLLFYVLVSIPGLAVLLPILAMFCRSLGVDDVSLLFFGIGGNFVLSMLEIPYILMRCRMESARFVLVTFLQFLLRVTGTIVAVAVFGLGIWGVLGMYWISGLLFLVILFHREFSLGTFRPDFSLFKPVARFALPFLPAGLCTFLQMNADRFLLARYFDLGEVGLYALAAKIAGCVALVTALPLQRVWLIRQFEVLPKPEGPTESARWFTLMTAVQCSVGLFLSLFSRELLTMIGKEDYIPCAVLIPPLVLADYFLYTSYFLEGPMFVFRRTTLKLYNTTASTVLTILLLFLLTPRFGAMGAALATVVGFAFMSFGGWFLSHRFCRRIPYAWHRDGFLLFTAIAIYCVSTDFGILSKSLLFGVFVVVTICVAKTHEPRPVVADG